MATSSSTRPLSSAAASVTHRRHFRSPPIRLFNTREDGLRSHPKSLTWKRAVLEARDQATPKNSSTVDMKQLVDFLYNDLPHSFDEQGLDPNAYEEKIRFRDPITMTNSLRAYMLNTAALKLFFRIRFHLHWVKQTGPYEITTRWTTYLKNVFIPWQQELVVTGISLMSVNPNTGKFYDHVDYWDSVNKNEHFSLEALCDVVKQGRSGYKSPDLETPSYEVLKRTANYEVRKYAPIVKQLVSTSFTDIDVEGLADPKAGEGIAAALKFRGKLPRDDFVRQKVKALRASLIKDGLKPKEGYMLVRYNDPKTTWSSNSMKNEVVIWLEDYKLE